MLSISGSSSIKENHHDPEPTPGFMTNSFAAELARALKSVEKQTKILPILYKDSRRADFEA